MATRKDVLQIVLETDGDGRVKASLANTGNELEKIENKAERANTASKTLTRTLGVFAGTVGAGIAINTIAEFERLEITLNNLGVSFDDVKDFASNVPFQLSQVADASIKLKAFGLDPLDGTMQALADQTANLGGSQETLNGIILAVGQAWAKQKLQGEEILQLVERGVPVWEILQKTTGKNVQQLQKLSEKGKLGREAIRGLITEMGKANFGASADQMKTVGGELSNLKDSADRLIAALGEAGLSSLIKSGAGLLGSLATSVRENKNEFLALAAIIAATRLGPLAVSAAVATRGMLTAAAAAKGLKGALALLGGPAGIIAGVATALGLWIFSAQDASASTQDLSDRVDGLLGNYKKLKQQQLTDTLDEITEKMFEQAEAIKQIKKNASISTAPLAGYEVAQINELTQSLIQLGTQYGKIKAKINELNTVKNNDPVEIIDTEAADKEYNRYLTQLARKYDALDRSLQTKEEREMQSHLNRQFIVEEAFQAGYIQESKHKELLEQLDQQHEQNRTRIAEDAAQERNRIATRSLGAAANIFDGLSALSNKAGEEQNERSKKFARLSIIASTAAAIMSALETKPYFLGIALAAGAAIKGRAQLKAVGGNPGGITQPGSTSSAGSPVNPIYTTPANNESYSQSPNITYQVNVYGDSYGMDDLDQTISDSIRRTVNNDGEIIPADSRQAADLRAA